MWPFKRKQPTKDGKVPAEVKQYYDSEHRERVGLAWLIAFLSLVLTVLIIAGLFFGGRWIYRKVVENNNPPNQQPTTSEGTGLEKPPAATTNPNQSKPNDLQPAAPSQNQGNSSSTGSSSSSSSGSSTSNSNSNSSSSSSNSSSSNTSTNSSSSSSNSNQSASSTSQPAEVTNTGPGNTLAIFAGSSILGALVFQGYQRRKLNQ